MLPDALVKELWSCAVKAAPGFTFIWQLLQRPVVPFSTRGLAEETKFAWKLACAHSFPWTPEVVETPS